MDLPYIIMKLHSFAGKKILHHKQVDGKKNLLVSNRTLQRKKNRKEKKLKEFATLQTFGKQNFVCNNSQTHNVGKELFISNLTNYSPSLPPCSIIFSPLSLFQVMFGVGEPVAAHFRVTLLPSLTTISVLVGQSRMSGGTANQRIPLLHYSLQVIKLSQMQSKNAIQKVPPRKQITIYAENGKINIVIACCLHFSAVSAVEIKCKYFGFQYK